MTRTREGRGLLNLIQILSVLGIVAFALLATPQAEANRGRCATADAPWPIILPDGAVHEGGRLKICLSLTLNPVTGLHEIQIGKYSIGRYMSRIGDSEGQVSDSPVLVFLRNLSGQHRLIGYAWPNGDSMRTYRLFDLSRPRKEALRAARTPLLEDIDTDDTSVLMAARLE